MNRQKPKTLSSLLDLRAELLGKMMAEYMAVKRPVFTILTPYGEFRGLYEPSDELQGFLRFDTQGHIIFGHSKLDDRILIQYDK